METKVFGLMHCYWFRITPGVQLNFEIFLEENTQPHTIEIQHMSLLGMDTILFSWIIVIGLD